MVAVGASAGRVRRALVVHPRRAGAPDTATTAGSRASPGVCASRGGGRDGVVLSVVRPVRAAADANYPRANGPRHDACPFDDGSHDDRADGVSDVLSDPLSLAYGVPDSLTRNIVARLPWLQLESLEGVLGRLTGRLYLC
jgi:hypothetical protein